MAKIQAVNERDFGEEVLHSALPVVVDFYADWCGPCRMLAPVLETVAKKFAGKAKVVKVNIDESPELASRFGIRSIPTLVGFKDGTPVAILAGYVPEKELERFFAKLIS